MSEDESGELSASTSERFLFMMTPDMVYDSATLSLEAIHKEQGEIRQLAAKLMLGMSVRSPSEPEWQWANSHLEKLTKRIEELGREEANAVRSFIELGTYRAA